MCDQNSYILLQSKLKVIKEIIQGTKEQHKNELENSEIRQCQVRMNELYRVIRIVGSHVTTESPNYEHCRTRTNTHTHGKIFKKYFKMFPVVVSKW